MNTNTLRNLLIIIIYHKSSTAVQIHPDLKGLIKAFKYGRFANYKSSIIKNIVIAA